MLILPYVLYNIRVMKPIIILASGSRKRSEILAACGIRHRVVPSRAAEILDARRSPQYNVRTNATIKARSVAQRFKAGYIIGADTIVQSGRKLFGKARSRQQSKQSLKQFSGRTVRVYTGLCVIDARTGRSASAVDCSQVRVKRLTPDQINQFMRIAGPHNLAGGFSIEGPGALIFDDVRGSFYNILGLPMINLNELFTRLGINLYKEAMKPR